MMKRYPIPVAGFSGSKFMVRYGLTDQDFGVSDGTIYVIPTLPDNPPIFESSDPIKKQVTLAELEKRIEVLEKKGV